MANPRPYIKKLRLVQDERTGLSQVTLRARVATGEKIDFELSPSQISSRREFLRQLEDRSVLLPPASERNAYLGEVADSAPQKVQKRVAHSGWSKNKRTFVLHTRVLGSDGGLLGLAAPGQDSPGWVTRAGSTKGWQDSVAQLALHSSYCMLAIASALAAPLLSFIRQPSFSICLTGRTRGGKTVAALAGSSVIGLGGQSQLLKWNMTPAALHEELTRYRDCFCPIDDFESIAGSDREKYQRIRDVSYGIQTGRERIRHSQSGFSSEQWRTIVFTSMEQSLGEFARSVQQERQGGEAIRMIDLPVSAASGPHIFDRAEDNGVNVSQAWKRQTFGALIEACSNHHGWVFERYIKGLIRSQGSLRTKVLKATEIFTQRVTHERDGDAANDLARLFGYIYAGGSIAIAQGVLPWRRAQLFEAVQHCYSVAREQLNDDGVVYRDGKKRLLDFVATLVEPAKIRTFSRVRGYVVMRREHCDCIIRVEAFNSLFSSPKQRELVLESLQSAGRIEMNTPRNGLAAPRYQRTWPDGSRSRSYSIRLPLVFVSR